MAVDNSRTISLVTNGGGTTSPRSSTVHLTFAAGGQLTVTSGEVGLSKITGVLAMATGADTGVGRMVCATTMMDKDGVASVDLELITDASALVAGTAFAVFFGA